MTLLVATQDPNATAETYVRQHMRMIAPGKTVGLALSGSGDAPGDIPFLHLNPDRRGLSGKIASAIATARHGYSGAPIGADRAAAKAFCQRHGVKIVLAEFGPTGAALMTLCKGLGIPLIVNFHGYDATVMPKSARVRSAYRQLARTVSGVVCGSRHFAGRVAEIGFERDQIMVVPCGIESALFQPGPDKTGNRIVAVGRLTPKKAPDLTIRAFAKAREEVPSLMLDMIGPGPLFDHFAGLIEDLGLSESVRLMGAQEPQAVRAALASADIFVQHSVVAPNGDTESQGISLIEAMAAALPVVATDHNGFSETVIDGETGFLVPERDTDGMAARIVSLAQDPALRARFGAAGRDRARAHFDASVTTDLMRAVIKKAVPDFDFGLSNRGQA